MLGRFYATMFWRFRKVCQPNNSSHLKNQRKCVNETKQAYIDIKIQAFHNFQVAIHGDIMVNISFRNIVAFAIILRKEMKLYDSKSRKAERPFSVIAKYQEQLFLLYDWTFVRLSCRFTLVSGTSSERRLSSL